MKTFKDASIHNRLILLNYFSNWPGHLNWAYGDATSFFFAIVCICFCFVWSMFSSLIKSEVSHWFSTSSVWTDLSSPQLKTWYASLQNEKGAASHSLASQTSCCCFHCRFFIRIPRGPNVRDDHTQFDSNWAPKATDIICRDLTHGDQRCCCDSGPD